MILRYLSFLPKFSARNPRWTLCLLVLISALGMPGIARLKLRTDGHALISPNAPEVIADKMVRQRFGIRDQIVIVLTPKSGDDIFTASTIGLIKQLTEALQRLPGLRESDVMSLATEPGFRMQPGTLNIQRLLDPPLETESQLSQLRDDLRRIELYSGTLVSTASKSTLILVGVPEETDRAKFHQEILKVIADFKDKEHEIGVTGAPVAESLFGLEILHDLGVPKFLLEGSQPDIAGDQAKTWPTILRELPSYLGHHLGLVPLAALVMMAVLLVCFRSIAATLVPLPGVMATMIFVLGLMGWMGVPIYLTTAVMPVLLTVISFTNDIYLFTRYFNLLRENPEASQLQCIDETFEKLVAPVAITSLSAVVGFVSFAASPLEPVRAFGFFTGIGTLYGMLLSLTVIPALLALIDPSRLLARRAKNGTGGLPAKLSSWFELIGMVILKHRWKVILLTAFLTLLTPFGIQRLVVQDSWTSGFAPESKFRRTTQQVNHDFNGMHQLLVSFNISKSLKVEVPYTSITDSNIFISGDSLSEPISIAGSWLTIRPRNSPVTEANTVRLKVAMADRIGSNILVAVNLKSANNTFWKELRSAGGAMVEIPIRTQLSPLTVKRINEFEEFLREQTKYSVGGVIGPADYLSTIRFIARGAGTDSRGLPECAVDSGILWDYYRVILGSDRLRQVMDADYTNSLITIFLKDANFVETSKLMTAIREYEKKHLSNVGVTLGFAGDVAVSQSIIQSIVATQMQSLLWSSLGIFLIIAWLSGSWLRGLLCLLPSLLAVAFKFAIMGWTDIPLGVATSMFAAMTLGIGVNCAIHFFESYDRALARKTILKHPGVLALRLTGPAAVINTLAVTLGFGVLTVSSVPANSRLGILLILGLVNCAVVSLSLLPALICGTKQKL